MNDFQTWSSAIVVRKRRKNENDLVTWHHAICSPAEQWIAENHEYLLDHCWNVSVLDVVAGNSRGNCARWLGSNWQVRPLEERVRIERKNQCKKKNVFADFRFSFKPLKLNYAGRLAGLRVINFNSLLCSHHTILIRHSCFHFISIFSSHSRFHVEKKKYLHEEERENQNIDHEECVKRKKKKHVSICTSSKFFSCVYWLNDQSGLFARIIANFNENYQSFIFFSNSHSLNWLRCLVVVIFNVSSWLANYDTLFALLHIPRIVLSLARLNFIFLLVRHKSRVVVHAAAHADLRSPHSTFLIMLKILLQVGKFNLPMKLNFDVDLKTSHFSHQIQPSAMM